MIEIHNWMDRSTLRHKNDVGEVIGSPPTTSRVTNHTWLTALLLAFLLFAGSNKLLAQISAYSYSENVSGTYSEITGGTIIATATGNSGALSMDSYTSPALTLPFSFMLNGVVQTTAFMNGNGFVSLGTAAPSAFTSSPISTTTVIASGIVAPFAGDLNTFFDIASRTGTMSWETVGTSPNREIVFQWKDIRPGYSTSTANVYGFSFQVRLLENNQIKIIYGPGSFAIGSTAVTGSRQIGLRGATTSDFNNRVFSSFAAASTAGALNNTTTSFSTATNFPASGLTLTWTTPLPCAGTPTAGSVTPVSQILCANTTPSTLTATGYTTGVTGLSFQWQSSTDNSVFADIPSATSNTYSPPVFAGTAAIYYRVRVTCASSSLFANSASVSVNPIANPSTQATTATSSNVGITGFTTSWTNGSGNRRMVILSNNPSITNPINGSATALTASTTYAGSGQQIVYDGTGTSVTVSGLTCNTPYYIKVYEYNRCGSGPYNYYYNVTGGTNVLTVNSGPVLASLPASNNFAGFTGADLSAVAPGWYEALGTAQNFNPAGTSSGWSSSTVLTGFTTAKINLFTAAKNEWIISPKVNLTAASQVTFKAAITNYNNATTDESGMQGTDDKVRVLVSTDGCGAIWTPLYLFDASSTTTLSNVLKDFAVNLSAYTGQTVQIAFQATDGPLDDLPDYDFHIGDIKVELIPSCAPPTGLSFSATNFNGTTINWIASSSSPGSGYEYEVRTEGTAGSGATGFVSSGTTAVGITSAVVSGLTADTTYTYYVRSNCGGSFSTWSSGVSFYTGYCVASSSSATYYINNFATTGGATNITNNASGATAGGYNNATSQSVSQYATGIVSVTASYGSTSTHGFNLFVDWNNDLDFDDLGEKVIAAGYGATASGSFSVPAGQPLGNYRMRAVANFSNGNPSACSTGISGETEDYTFTVVAPPACVPPTALTTSSLSDTTATLAWTAASPVASNGYQYEIRTSGAPESGATGFVSTGNTSAGVTSAAVTGLTANTTYTYYVRSNCGGSFSTWTLGYSFFTGYCASTGSTSTYFLNNFVTTGGATNITNNASGYSTGGYNYLTAQSVSQFATGTVNFTASYSGTDTFGLSIFVDWNNDLDFNDAGEKVFGTTGYESTTSATITVPTGQIMGNYRMRVVANYSSTTPVACNNAISGETEDYIFTVVAPPAPCTGTPTSGTVTPITQSICTSSTPGVITATGYTAGPTGITLQWQSSTDNVVFTNITGATSATYAPPAFLGTTVYYRLRVTCSASSLFADSASVTVNSIASPSTQASAATTTAIALKGFTAGWTNGNGNRRMVIISNSPSITDPVNGNAAALTANATYSGSGQQIVYDGVGTSVAISGLTCNTAYYYKVYDYRRCGSGPYDYYYNVTTGTNAATATTAAPAAAVALPANNNFAGFTGSNLSVVFPGWTEAVGTAQNLNPGGTSSAWSNTTLGGYTTARLNLYIASRNEWIISPRVNLTAASRVTFKAAITDFVSTSADATGMQGTDDKVKVLISSDGCGNVWTPLYTFQASNTSTLSNTLQNFELDLSAYTGQAIQIAFQATDGPIDDVSDYDFHIGDIKIELLPSCFAVTGLAVATPNATTANVSWTAASPAPAVGYQYAVTTSATPPVSGTATTSTSVSVGSLVGGTTYYAHVRSECIAGTDFSTWETKMFKYILGDNCSNAINLGALTSPVTGDTTGATNDYSIDCSGGNTSPDLFYYIDVPSAFTLVIGQTENDYDSENYIGYGGACPGTTQIACYDDSDTLQTTWTNNTGSTQRVYWVQDGYNNDIQVGPFTLAWTLTAPPIGITSFSPVAVCSSSVTGTEVILTGTNFTGVTLVELAGVSTPFQILSDTSIKVTLAATSTGGVFTVYNAVTSAISATSFTVNTSPAVQEITSAGGVNYVCLPITNTLKLSNVTPTGLWTSSNIDAATVDGDGYVSPVAAGNTVISYTVTDPLTGCKTVKTFALTVNDPIIISAITPSQTVVTGGNTTFGVTFDGSGPLSYFWEVCVDGSGENFIPVTNGGVYSNADTAILTLTGVPIEFNEYLYQVTVTGACGAVTSDLAYILVGDTGIVTQPSNVTVCDSNLADVSFTIVASPDVDSEEIPGAGYQWQEDFGGGLWHNVVNGGIYSGATTPTLTLSGITFASTGWKYKCLVSGVGTAESNPAILTVVESVSVVTDPQPQTVCYSGGSTEFAVAASGGVASYQWEYSFNGGTWGTVATNVPAGTTYSGVTSTNLTVNTTGALPAGTHAYRAVVIGTAPCGSVYSASAQLLINTPSISGQPAATSVIAGTTATFTVATLAASPTYQWQYATAVGGPYNNVMNATPIGITYTGANTATLSVVTSGATTLGAANFYRAIVSSPIGCSVTSNGAKMTVTNYCVPLTSSGGAGDIVTQVVITNVSTGTNVAQTSSGAAPWYTFYNNTPLNVTQGQNMTTAITVGTDGNQHTAVWIDYDRNGVFDASENVGRSTTSAGSGATVTYSFIVPFTATPGPTRIRIRGASDSAYTAAGACLSSTYGETEDYVVNINAAPACSGIPTAATITTSATAVCISGTVTLSTNYASGFTGTSLQWYNSVGIIAGATSASYTTPTITASETYYVRVICANGGGFADSNSITINVNNPSVASTTPASRCGTGTVTLSATGSAGAQLNWYAAATGGTALFTGANFTTPTIAATTNYYVAASTGGSAGNSGRLAPAAGDSGFSTTNWGIVFDVLNPLTLQSVDIYSTSAGTIDIKIMNATLTTELFSTGNVAIAAGGTTTPNVVPINFALPIGTGYRILVKAYTGISIIRSSSAVAFPYNSTSMNVTSSEWGGITTSSYYFFYNLQYSTGCTSARTAVAANVSTPPVLTLSSASANLCVGTPSSLVTITSNKADYNTYVWSPATGVTGNENDGYTFNPATTTTYTLTASQIAGSQCQNVATFTVTVNPYLSALTIAPANSTICLGDIVALSATGGTAGATSAYCTPAMTTVSAGGDYIKNFAYANISNLNTTDSPTDYTYYSTLTANVVAGVSNPVTLQAGGESSTYAQQFRIWIDLNHDGLFSAAESVFNTTASTFSPNDAIGSITIPTTAYNGVTRLRVASRYSSTVGAGASCAGESQWGEFEDYNVNISGGTDNVTPSVWSPIAGLFTDAAGNVSYTGTAVGTVYAKPTTTTAYTAIVTSAAGCPTTSNVATVNVKQLYPFYADNDGDGYGVGVIVNVCAVDAVTPPANYSLNNTDCNDADEAVYRNLSLFVDADGDGYDAGSLLPACYGATLPIGTSLTTLGTDCNDQIAAINPGAVEIPFNGVDDNCDGIIDNGSQVTTSLLPSICNTTLASIGSVIGITTLAPGSAYTGWRIRATNGSQIQIIDKTVPFFSMTDFASYTYATTYTIDIELQRNGVWLGYYGSTCQISTPAILAEGGAASVSPLQCGITLAKINTLIATTSIQGVTGYRFRVTNMTDLTGPNQVQIVTRGLNWFTLQMLTRYNYGTTYQIEVAVKTTGDFGGYGSPCEISSPSSPSLTNCDAVIPSKNTIISCTSLTGVTQYRFQVTRDSDLASTTIDRSVNYFTFGNVPSSILTYGALYNIRVAVMTAGTWSPYGDACQITAPSTNAKPGVATTETAMAAFKAVAAPNPFASEFSIDVTTPNQENVTLRVYDMLGKLIESREVKVSEMISEKVGAQYPSGVYNVVVTQGEIVKTLRVIKR